MTVSSVIVTDLVSLRDRGVYQGKHSFPEHQLLYHPPSPSMTFGGIAVTMKWDVKGDDGLMLTPG